MQAVGLAQRLAQSKSSLNTCFHMTFCCVCYDSHHQHQHRCYCKKTKNEVNPIVKDSLLVPPPIFLFRSFFFLIQGNFESWLRNPSWSFTTWVLSAYIFQSTKPIPHTAQGAKLIV